VTILVVAVIVLPVAAFYAGWRTGIVQTKNAINRALKKEQQRRGMA
jgi:hypothetical protein